MDNFKKNVLCNCSLVLEHLKDCDDEVNCFPSSFVDVRTLSNLANFAQKRVRLRDTCITKSHVCC